MTRCPPSNTPNFSLVFHSLSITESKLILIYTHPYSPTSDSYASLSPPQLTTSTPYHHPHTQWPSLLPLPFSNRYRPVPALHHHALSLLYQKEHSRSVVGLSVCLRKHNHIISHIYSNTTALALRSRASELASGSSFRHAKAFYLIFTTQQLVQQLVAPGFASRRQIPRFIIVRLDYVTHGRFSAQLLFWFSSLNFISQHNHNTTHDIYTHTYYGGTRFNHGHWERIGKWVIIPSCIDERRKMDE